MREYMTIVESASSRKLIEASSGQVPVPKVVYHGTNIIAACGILRDNRIEATEPVDDDGLGASVSVSADARIAAMFATEFARTNSEYDVGIVFSLNGAKISKLHKTVYHEAETASFNEQEFRILGDVTPLKSYVIDIRFVGDLDLLDDEDFIERVIKDAKRQYHHNWTDQTFWAAYKKLLKTAKR